ncbi:hypothetical protein F3Y22_tig00110457pilonHSYRG00204 [Hibiscus syriacus]|uniref:Uncharacterized protein n=1 Tax=Hibiscus syriacus TaxID=106335 RepID=A0A6A3AKN4_HIBSY|nr:hypothetical protein F3Y22_tig00110457pilonHSYRG00204 [Hibiscus syriacus]
MVALFKAAAFGVEVGDVPGDPLMEDGVRAPVGEAPTVGEPAGDIGGAGGEEAGEDSGAEEGVVAVDGGEAVGVAVGDVVGETLGAGVGEEDRGDLVGAELGACPRAQLTMRAKRTKQAKVFAIVEF